MTGLLLEHPEVTALLARLDRQSVVFEAEPPADVAPALQQADNARPEIEGDTLVLVWSDALQGEAVSDAVRSAGFSPLSIVHLNPLADPAAQFDGLQSEDLPHVLVLTKAWEPPVLAFTDLLSDLRERIGDVPIAVVPIGLSGGVAQATDLAVWRDAINRHADAATYVLDLTGARA